jgi:hypothetical protein
MAGEVNYGLVNPAVLDYAGQEQKALNVEKSRMDVQRLEEERKLMLGMQKQLADSGQDPDLNIIFDTMIKSGNPDYMSKGLEGKFKLKEQQDYARAFYGDETPKTAAPPLTPTAPGAYGAPLTPEVAPATAPTNALGSMAGARQPMTGTNALARTAAPNQNEAMDRINRLLATGNPRAIQTAQVLQSQLKAQGAGAGVVVGAKGTLVNPVTGEVIFRNTSGGGEGGGSGVANLSTKDIQKREMAYPQATAAIDGFEKKSENFVTDLEKLRDHPGLDEITGIAAGRLPGITKEGRAAQTLYDKIVAKGGFQALQDMRDASKTGGALGNVSNQEGKQLVASFAAINRTQDAPDVREALNTAISDVQGARTRMREAYNTTYEYRPDKKSQTTTKTSTAIPSGAVEMLRKDPKLAKDFDAKYGAGASAKILR